ncbi:MAG: hypothetical protein HY762_01440 [Planctomycetes bacterium]|nr:hypothetical protein [Planctomycetota bacterium]
MPVKPPFIHIFPFDIVMIFVPYPIIDHHEAYFILSKYKKPDVKKSLEQAEILKEHLQKTLQNK